MKQRETTCTLVDSAPSVCGAANWLESGGELKMHEGHV